MALVISSPAFKSGENIPVRYTADGQNISPALNWSGAPSGTASLALIIHDPDAPRLGGYTHWVIFNLPPASTGLPEAVSHAEKLSDGTVQGKNTGGTNGYVGPAPPPGKPHHYHFMLYALDLMLNEGPGAGKNELQAAINGHILAETELVGMYGR